MGFGRVSHIAVALLAAYAIGAVMSAAALAVSEPPEWTTKDSATVGSTKIKDASLTSRLWVTSLSLVIVCKKDTSTGTIENNAAKEGIDTGNVTYNECTVWSTTKNAAKQWIQKEELKKCTVKSTGEAAGTIKPKELSSFLAFIEDEAGGVGETPVEIADVFKAKTGEVFVTIEVGGEGCAAAVTAEVKGSVIGKIPRSEAVLSTQEAVMGDLLFETTNVEAGVSQRYKRYKLKAGPGETEDVLKFGTNAAALESTEQVELESLEPFGVFQ
jgi:hypothetical protein